MFCFRKIVLDGFYYQTDNFTRIEYMKRRRQIKPELTLKTFRLWLITRDSNMRRFARECDRSPSAFYRALKNPRQCPGVRQLLEEAFNA